MVKMFQYVLMLQQMNFFKKMFGMDKPAETKKPAKKTVKKAAKKTAKKTVKKSPKKLTKKKK